MDSNIKVLIWNSKHEPQIYFAGTTPEEELDAYFRVFKDMDAWTMFAFYEEDPARKNFNEGMKLARGGNVMAAKALVLVVRDDEYGYTEVCGLR